MLRDSKNESEVLACAATGVETNTVEAIAKAELVK